MAVSEGVLPHIKVLRFYFYFFQVGLHNEIRVVQFYTLFLTSN